MNHFQVGYSQIVANPPLGIGIDGYFVPRFAKGSLDDIEVSALLVSCQDIKIMLVGIDNCGVDKKLIKQYAAAIERETKIPAENVFIAASHSHTAPLVNHTDAFSCDKDVVEAYATFLGEKVAEAASLALKDLKNAKMGYAVGRVPDKVAYIRRYKMKDGSTWTCPPINDENIDYPLGTIDPRVNVLRFDREDAPSVVLVNYGLHADTTNGELLSADWPGWMRKTLEKALDGTKCLFFAGAEGDVGSTNIHPQGGDMNDTEISFDNEMKSPGMARFVGRAMAGTVLQVYDKVNYVDVDRIQILQRNSTVLSNKPAPEDMPRAKQYRAWHDADRDDLIPFTAMELTTVVAEAIRMCNLENGPDTFEIGLTGVKLGPVALLGIAGEPFTDIGVALQDAEGWDMVMPCALTNGSMGYFPTKAAYDEGGYEARSSPFLSGVAEKIVEDGIKLLNDLRG